MGGAPLVGLVGLFFSKKKYGIIHGSWLRIVWAALILWGL